MLNMETWQTLKQTSQEGNIIKTLRWIWRPGKRSTKHVKKIIQLLYSHIPLLTFSTYPGLFSYSRNSVLWVSSGENFPHPLSVYYKPCQLC